MVEISLPLGAEIAYDWILIIIQLYFMFLHFIRLRIQYRKASSSKKQTMFKRIDSRTLSIGILFFALFVVFNRFFGIIGIYGTTLKSCDIYLSLAVILTIIHKTFNYQFILFRLKSQLESFDPSKTPTKLKWILFYIFSAVIIIFEIYLTISIFLQNPLSEIDDNRCNFSQIAVERFVPIYGGADLLFSIILLFFFAFGLWKYTKIEKNASRKTVKKTLQRIMIWSVIAICSTLISTIIAAMIDGASPIFLVGDTVINSICAVMQFAPINKDLDKPYTQQCGVFIRIVKKEIFQNGRSVKQQKSVSSAKHSAAVSGSNSNTVSTQLTNFGVKGNLGSSDRKEGGNDGHDISEKTDMESTNSEKLISGDNVDNDDNDDDEQGRVNGTVTEERLVLNVGDDGTVYQ